MRRERASRRSEDVSSSSLHKDEEDTARRKRSRPHDAPVGNFANYYAIRTDVQSSSSTQEMTDIRVLAISEWLDSRVRVGRTGRRRVDRMLDIGCNSGRLTLQLASGIRDDPSFVVGVDIDEDLISQAQSLARTEGWEKPSKRTRDHTSMRNSNSIGAAAVGYSRSEPKRRMQLIEKRAAAFWACDWVYVDQKSEERASTTMTDDEFKTLQAAKFVSMQDQKGYDLITVLSVTKWIQLSYYDDGLRRFFARIVQSLRPGGILVLEPQPYKSYKSLHKVTKPDSQERRNLKAIRVLPDDFPWILTVELGLDGPFYVRERGSDSEFMRDIQAYIKPVSDIIQPCKDRCFELLQRRKNDDPLISANLDSIPWVSRQR